MVTTERYFLNTHKNKYEKFQDFPEGRNRRRR